MNHETFLINSLLELPGKYFNIYTEVNMRTGKIQNAFSYDIRLTDLHKIDVVEHIDHNNKGMICLCDRIQWII